MNLLDILSTGELYRIAGYSKKTSKENIHIPYFNLEVENFEKQTHTGYQGVFNWSNMQYISMSTSIKKILGYDKDVFLLRGINFALSIVHPTDLLLLRNIHIEIFNYYYNTPNEQRGKLRFSYNLRIKAADNSYVTILRQSNFLSFTDDGKPALEYINCTDITQYRFTSSINLAIHKLSPSGIYVLCHETEFSDSHHTLSKREMEVLELARKGYTSKEIAEKLYLCIETVKSHRKHIIAKTGSGNMTAAINKIDKL
ncbi:MULTISPECIES: helix-turn-helix transcriptional regulator [Pedobacter]|uniref:response regulator transcription factor n=1 Tax=Pedobacter TaxID=84567 RepID=UPI00292F98B2|nr:helix-turn-helix transcriptional regulator [Pedobacter aquatilis]